jgi:hypothetical protein
MRTWRLGRPGQHRIVLSFGTTSSTPHAVTVLALAAARRAFPGGP